MKRSAPILWFTALLSLVTAGVSGSGDAADTLCRCLSDPLRRLLSVVSSLVRFPVFEIAVLVLPALLFIRLSRDFPRRAPTLAGVLFSLFLLLSVLPARRGAPNVEPVAGDDLFAFAAWLSDHANREEARLPVSSGEGTPPARESTADLSAAVTAALRESGLCPVPPVRVKATLFPGVLRRLGLLGYHVSWTGEAIYRPDAPAYTLPFTAAHEAAHQAGILSEGEASLAAYVALIASGDPALRYAGWTGALDACLPLLDEGARGEIVASLSPRVREDLKLFDALLPTCGSAGAYDGENAAAIRLRGGGKDCSYDVFPHLACRRYLALSGRDQADPPAIY